MPKVSSLGTIKRIHVMIRSRNGSIAQCMYYPNGLMNGGHMSPPPMPMVHEEKGKLEAEVRDKLWEMAEDLDADLNEENVCIIDASRNGRAMFLIEFEDGERWGFWMDNIHEHDDPKVIELMQLISENHVGGW